MDERLVLHLEDGMQFLQQREEGYELIFIDLHDAHGMAPVVQDPEFFASCQQRLAPGGLLSINLWYGYRDEEERTVRGLLEDQFDGRILYLPVAGKRNCIALASRDALERDREVLEARAEEWRERSGLNLAVLLADLWRLNQRVFDAGTSQ